MSKPIVSSTLGKDLQDIEDRLRRLENSPAIELFLNAPRTIYYLHGGQDETNYGSSMTSTGAWQPFGSSWALLRIDALPPISGYQRQLRYSCQMLYQGGGATGANFYQRLSVNSNAFLFFDPGSPYGGDKEIDIVTAWQDEDVSVGTAELLALTNNQHYYLLQLANYITVGPVYYLRAFQIEGRYVRI